MSLLPGWFPGAAVAAAPLILSEFAGATSTAATITVPSGVQSGDLLVLLDRATSMSVPATVIPAGFTEIVNTTSSSMRQIASYKIANGSEGGAGLTGMSGLILGKAIYVFRGSAPIADVTVSTPNAAGTSGNPAQQTVNASGGAAPLIVFGCYGSTGAVSPRTFTPAKDGEINPDTALYLAYRIFNSAPADVTIDMDDEGTINILQSFYIECSG